jgi:hypothetical protein
MLEGDGGFATARRREPASTDRLPSHRSESPTGYSSAGAPQQSPLPLRQSPTIVAQSRSSEAIRYACSTFTAAMPFRSRSSCPPPTAGVISTLHAGCHFYIAPTGVQKRSASLEREFGCLLPQPGCQCARYY